MKGFHTPGQLAFGIKTVGSSKLMLLAMGVVVTTTGKSLHTESTRNAVALGSISKMSSNEEERWTLQILN